MLSRSGDYLTGGRAVLLPRGEVIEARVTELTEPGTLLNAYVSKGQRWFVLSLEDGRALPAELLGTTWQSAGRRLCCFLLTPSEASLQV